MERHLRTTAEIERLRARAMQPEFAAAWAHLTQQAELVLEHPVLPSAAGGGWGHHYHCPTHSLPLSFDPDRPGEHLCPVDGENIVGDHMDRAWRSKVSDTALRGARTCALVWVATGDQRLLAHARAVLTRYCEIYPSLPPHGDIVGVGRVHGTALEESVWAIGLARLVDDLRPALDTAEVAAADELLAQVLDQVTSELMGKIHNIECWHLAARLSLAAVLDRAPEIEETLAGEFGLLAQLSAGIRDDGWWAEGSPHYHFYMLHAVVAACAPLLRSDPEIVRSSQLAAMIGTPLTLLRSDLSLPALNDGWADIAQPGGITQFAPLFEHAFSLWPTPAIPAVLSACYRLGTPRDSVESLLYGPGAADLQDPQPLPPVRAVHAASGYAVLDDGVRSLLLKFGPHGGGHGHPDKLQFDLHVRGARVMPDLGAPAYNSPLQGPWIRQTLSHDTATFAGISQPPVCGVLLSAPHDVCGAAPTVLDAGVHWYADDPTVHGSWLHEPRTAFPHEYEDAAMRRVVLWSPRGYLVDLFSFVVPSQARTDLASRLSGDLSLRSAGGGTPRWEPLGPTQQDFLRDPRPLPAGPWQGIWEIDGERTNVWCLDPPGTTAVRARCPGATMEEEQELVLRSLTARSGTFVSVIDLDGTVRDVEVRDGSVLVHHTHGNDTWTPTEGRAASTVEHVDAPGGVHSRVALAPWRVPVDLGENR